MTKMTHPTNQNTKEGMLNVTACGILTFWLGAVIPPTFAVFHNLDARWK
jgi:hypothetical protein